MIVFEHIRLESRCGPAPQPQGAAGVILWRQYRPTYGAFLLLAHIRSEVTRAILSLALAFTTHLFVNGYWAG